MFGNEIKMLIGGIEEVLGEAIKSTLSEKVAKFSRQLFVQLKDEGFTDEQAIAIMTGIIGKVGKK
jgi:hypothetical protein